MFIERTLTYKEVFALHVVSAMYVIYFNFGNDLQDFFCDHGIFHQAFIVSKESSNCKQNITITFTSRT